MEAARGVRRAMKAIDLRAKSVKVPSGATFPKPHPSVSGASVRVAVFPRLSDQHDKPHSAARKKGRASESRGPLRER